MLLIACPAYLLTRCLEVALEERATQLANFKQTTACLESGVLADWMQRIKAWQEEEDLPMSKRTVENLFSSSWKKGSCLIYT